MSADVSHIQKIFDSSYLPEMAEFAEVGSDIYFVRDDPRYGDELWTMSKDETAPHLVKDLAPGVQGSFIHSLTPVENGVYFIADSLIDYFALEQQPHIRYPGIDSVPSLYFVAKGTDDVVEITTYKDLKGIPRQYPYALGMKSTQKSADRLIQVNNHLLLGTRIANELNTFTAVSQATNAIYKLLPSEVEINGVPRLMGSVESIRSNGANAVFLVSHFPASRSNTPELVLGTTDGTVDGTNLLQSISISDLSNTTIESVDRLSATQLLVTISDRDGTRLLNIDMQSSLVTEIGSSQRYQDARLKPTQIDGTWYFIQRDANGEDSLHATNGSSSGTVSISTPGVDIRKLGTQALHSFSSPDNKTLIATLATTTWDPPVVQFVDAQSYETFAVAGLKITGTIVGEPIQTESKLYLVEGLHSSQARLIEIDSISRSFRVVMESAYNEAIGQPFLSGDTLFFTHIKASESRLMRYDGNGVSPRVVAQVASDAWEGIVIESVQETHVTGYFYEQGSAALFEYDIENDRLRKIATVAPQLSPAVQRSHYYGDYHPSLITRHRLDSRTVVMQTGAVINGQIALKQLVLLGDGNEGFRKLLSASVPQPSVLMMSQLSEKAVFRINDKIIYQFVKQTFEANNRILSEYEWRVSSRPTESLVIDRGPSNPSSTALNAIGVIGDHFYYFRKSIETSTTEVVRTKLDLSGVEIVGTVPGGEIRLLHQPESATSAQRARFAVMRSSSEQLIDIFAIDAESGELRPLNVHNIWDAEQLPPKNTSVNDYQTRDGLTTVAIGALAHSPFIEMPGTNGLVPFFASTQERPSQFHVTGRGPSYWYGFSKNDDGSNQIWYRMDESLEAVPILIQAENEPKLPTEFIVTAALSDFLVIQERNQVVYYRVGLNGEFDLLEADRAMEPGIFTLSKSPVLAYPARGYGAIDRGTQSTTDLIFSANQFYSLDSMFYQLSEDGRSFVPAIKLNGRATTYGLAAANDGYLASISLPDASDFRDPFPGFRPDLVWIKLGTATARQLPESSEDYRFVGNEQSFAFIEGSSTLWEHPASDTSRLDIDASQRTGRLTFDLGELSAPTRFPSDSIHIKVSAGTTIELLGQTAGPVTYEFREGELVILVGDLALYLSGSPELIIQDHLQAATRNWNFTAGDDRVVVDRIDEETLTLEVQNLPMKFFVDSSQISSPGRFNIWNLQMRTGIDSVSMPLLQTFMQSISILNDSDLSSQLDIRYPDPAPLVTNSTPNGEQLSEVKSGPYSILMQTTSRPHHNVIDRFDVDANGAVTPLDALKIINFLARRSRAASEKPAMGLMPDVSGDGHVTGVDALQVVNAISRRLRSQVQSDGLPSFTASKSSGPFAMPFQQVPDREAIDQVWTQHTEPAAIF